jgi:hypothetical protein
MKSAYERAMEKLQAQNGPLRELGPEQREAIAEIDRKYDSQAAQVNLDFDQKLAAAATFEALQSLRAEKAAALQSIEEKRERDKNAVWEEGK